MGDSYHASDPKLEHSTEQMLLEGETLPVVVDASDSPGALADIRKALENHGCRSKDVDDATLLRFLRARSMNAAKAAKMFVHYQKWRASFVPLGHIPENQVANELATKKIGHQGFSKKGWPLLLAFPARHYPSKENSEEFKRFVVYVLDKVIASAPSGVEKMIVLVDMNSFGYKNVDLKGMATGFQLLQNYYPERLGRLYMLNVPKLFNSVWKCASHFLDKATKDKIVFLESHEVADVLRSEVDLDSLPSIFGGKADIVLLQDARLASQFSAAQGKF